MAGEFHSDDEHGLLEEQRAFYRARAPEYDEWWQRRGRYDRGPELEAEWDRQVAEIEQALEAFAAGGDVLELAGGTGWWTQRLAASATRLTVVDASAETLDLNRRRVARTDVEYVVADLFSWEPDRPYDVVFFSFWLSHVPRVRFSHFWELVRSCLAPGGRVFLIDNRIDPGAAEVSEDPYVIEYGPDLHLRRLKDGRQYRVVKVMYEPDELQLLLRDEGWNARIRGNRWFIFGEAEPQAYPV
jgi:demethylmenaquinone methyltransferase/2-methoxy-6-polyprenyl-1,4-benzoquinol methylase